MDSAIHIGEKEIEHNPINNRNYQELLCLNPTLSHEIKKRVELSLSHKFTPPNKRDLNDNFGILDVRETQIAKDRLIQELKVLELFTGTPKHIKVVVDNCFTNKQLLILLRRILGKEYFNRFVDIVDIDYKKPSNDSYLDEHLSSNHSLFILGGSLSDTYDIDESHYQGCLAENIKQVSDDYYQRVLNKRFLGICFGQQFLANIIGIANRNSPGIIATVKGPAQLAPSNCQFGDLAYVNHIYPHLLRGLTNDGINLQFSTIFTRTGYVDFDFLKSGGNLGIVPLITDETSGGVVGWGSKNGNVLGIQFHPEISFSEQRFYFLKHLNKLLPHLSKDEEDRNKILGNFSGIENRQDIGDAFYVHALLGYMQDINRTYIEIGHAFSEEEVVPSIPPSVAIQRLRYITSHRIGHTLGQDDSSSDHKRKWINSIDRKQRLLLNHRLDWKVNRSIEEISEILGLTSIIDLIRIHKAKGSQETYLIRDLGAGDGSTIKQLSDALQDPEIVIYGVGDYIYFDLFSGIKRTQFKDKLPEELLVLFVEKVVKAFEKETGTSTIERVKKALNSVSFSKDDKVIHSSMTSKKTYMFENEDVGELPKEIKENFDSFLPILEELKQFIKDNFHSLFGGLFQHIYISKFNDLNIEDDVISKVDFQYSIRSTSHVNGREYMKIISNYVFNSAKPGSIYIDNGVHQSYTSIPRLNELHKVSLDLAECQFKLIYHRDTNYFCSVVIVKGDEFDEESIKPFLREGTELVSLREANRSTFFKFEYFIRNFIISNFKNSNVFWDFNSEIIGALKQIMQYLESKNTDNINRTILNLINHIAGTYRNGDITYNSIDMDVLTNYSIDGETLKDLIRKPLYTPSWMNIRADRK